MTTAAQRDSAQLLSCLRGRPSASLKASTALIPAAAAFAVMGLLAMPSAAFAQDVGTGGTGGGGAGGDSVLVSGGSGTAGGNGVAAGSGGGGTGATGGNGGTGSGGTAGGVGNNVFDAPAGNGADATLAGNGGGGGAGAATRFLAGGALTFFGGPVVAISGGAGGAGLGSGSGGGGGAGATLVASLQFNASIGAGGSRTGGAGGAGGNGGVSGNGGNGGDGGPGFTVVLGGINNIPAGAGYFGGAGGAGGSGVVAGLGGNGGAGLNQTNGTLVNMGTVRGGNGGTGSVAGAAGIGLIGSGVTIDNQGLIAGGLSGSGAQGVALSLSGASTITNLGTLTGGIEIASGTLAFNLPGDRTLSAVVSGAGGLIKLGADTLTLSGANTYTGLTTVSAGTLAISNNTALGSAAAGTIVEDGAALALTGNLIIADALTLSGTGVDGTGALRSVSGVSSLTGAITLETDVRVEAATGAGLELRGIVAADGRTITFGGNGNINIQFGNLQLGSGSVIKEGTGILALAATNTYTGDTDVRAGQLQILGGNALSDTGRLTIGFGSSVRAFNDSETIGSLAGGGNLVLVGGSIVVGDTSDSVFSGAIATQSGNGTITKVGTGTLTLSGFSTYTGQTNVSAGTLRIENPAALGAASGVTVVEDGATLEFALPTGTSIGESLTLNGTAQTLGVHCALTVRALPF